AAGLRGWTSILQGGASPGDVARGFLASPEYQASLVQSYYQNFLERAAEQEGLSGWTGALASGLGTTNLTIGITTSPEYQRLYGSDSAFVQSLYANILGRQGDPSGVEA